MTRTGLGLAAGVMCAMLLNPLAAQAAVKRAGKRHLLVVTVTKGFRHDSIPLAEETIQALGDKTGLWDTDFVRTDEDMQAKMTPAALSHYDAVVFANTTGVLPLPDPQGFLDYIRAGHGYAGFHSASDTFHQWPGSTSPVSEYVQFLGGEFLTHHGQTSVVAHIEDMGFPGIKMLMNAAKNMPRSEVQDLQHQSVVQGHVWNVYDEIYLLKNNDRTNVHVILSMDKYPNDGSPEANQPGDHLLAWDKAYGKGRVFYTELGHRQEMWHDPLYQAFITGGLEFALGIAKANTTNSTAIPVTSGAH